MKAQYMYMENLALSDYIFSKVYIMSRVVKRTRYFLKLFDQRQKVKENLSNKL